MPYRKYNRRYSKRYKKRKGNIFWRRLNNKSYYMAKKALSMLNVEYKCLDTDIADSATSQTPILHQLTNSVQGDTQTTRDGSQIKLTRILLRYKLKLNSSATGGSSVRVMLIQDNQTNGAIFTAADILVNTSGSGAAALISPLVIDNKFRFRVLYSKLHNMNFEGRDIQSYQKIFNFKDLKIRYNGNAGTIADITSKSLVLLTVTDAATAQPRITAYVRVRFIDN